MSLYVASIAGGVGTYITLKMCGRLSKDKMYVHVVMTDNKNEIIKLREYLIDNKIPNLVTDGYTKEWRKTLAITIYSETRHDSKLIDEYLSNTSTKMKRVVYK